MPKPLHFGLRDQLRRLRDSPLNSLCTFPFDRDALFGLFYSIVVASNHISAVPIVSGTVNAGSFFGFGPLFFGPASTFGTDESGQMGSLATVVEYILTPGPGDPPDAGVDTAVVLVSEAGNGQSGPP